MSKSLNIVFMGTPGFAVASLAKLHNSLHKVLAVVTAPDRPAGRGRKLRASEVKEFAIEAAIDVLQPEKLKSEQFLQSLASYEADLFVVVAFRMLPERVWAMPALGTINLHGSLLPQYRGAAPINWALINGEKSTGVTTFYINAEIDKGKIIEGVHIDIADDDTAGSLHDRMMHIGADLVLKTCDAIADGNAAAKSQEAEETELMPAPKLSTENRAIDWTRSALDIRNLVRGLCPYPAATATLYMEQEIGAKIFSVLITETSDLSPGDISCDNRSRLLVGTSTFDIQVEELQLSGKRKMRIKDLLNGFEITTGSKFL